MATRDVRFYRIVSEAHEAFSQDLDFGELLNSVASLPLEGAYVKLDRFEVLGMAYFPPPGPGARGTVPLLVLDRIDRDPRLRIQRARAYRPLTLDEDETLAEPTFFALFPDNVLAVMRNSGSAPGVSSLRDYVNTLELLSERIAIVPLADRNAMRAIHDIDTLTRFDFAVGGDVNLDVFGQESLLARTIRSAREQLGSVQVELSVKLSPRGPHDASDALKDEIETIVRNPEAREALAKAEFAYRRLEDGRAHTYNLLNEAVAKGGEVDLNPDTSKPTEPSAAEGIFKVYQALYDDIRSAIKSAVE